MKKNDPNTYLEMSKPHESVDKANEDLEKFYEEVSELRKKYKLREVFVIVETPVIFNSEEEFSDSISNCYFGNALNKERICTYAYGQAKQEQEEMIGKYLKGKRK